MSYPKIEVVGDKVVVTIDASKAALEAAKLSSTGKSRVVASTNGFTNAGGIKLSLNCIVPEVGGK